MKRESGGVEAAISAAGFCLEATEAKKKKEKQKSKIVQNGHIADWQQVRTKKAVGIEQKYLRFYFTGSESRCYG